jgi:hypothetical protein
MRNESSVGGDPEVPPLFSCEACGGKMHTQYCKGLQGYKYPIESRMGKKEVEGSSQSRIEEGMGMGWSPIPNSLPTRKCMGLQKGRSKAFFL